MIPYSMSLPVGCYSSWLTLQFSTSNEMYTEKGDRAGRGRWRSYSPRSRTCLRTHGKPTSNHPCLAQVCGTGRRFLPSSRRAATGTSEIGSEMVYNCLKQLILMLNYRFATASAYRNRRPCVVHHFYKIWQAPDVSQVMFTDVGALFSTQTIRFAPCITVPPLPVQY